MTNTEQRNDAVRSCQCGAEPMVYENMPGWRSHIYCENCGNAQMGSTFDEVRAGWNTRAQPTAPSPLEGEVRDRAVEAAFRSIAGDEVDPHMCPEAWEHAEAVALAILAALSTGAGSGEDCGECGGDGVIGYLPDDLQDCPSCRPRRASGFDPARLRGIPVWMVRDMRPGWQDQGAAAYHGADAIDRLEKALTHATEALRKVGNDYPGSSCQKWCNQMAGDALAMARGERK